MKRLLQGNISPTGGLDTEKYTRAILQVRNTPDPANGISPAQVIFGREIRDVLPVKPRTQIFDNGYVKPKWKELWASRESTLRLRSKRQMEELGKKSRNFSDLKEGDFCFIQNQYGNNPKRWSRSGRIVKIAPHDQYIVKVAGSNLLTLRNRKFLRKFPDILKPCAETNLRTLVAPSANPLSLLGKGDSVSTDNAISADMTEQPIPSVESETENNEDPGEGPNADMMQYPPTEDTEEIPIIRQRPARERSAPQWHKDYVVGGTCMI